LLEIRKSLFRNQRGFSLIELMVAIAILGAAAFGIFQSFQAGFWGMSDARARTIATNIAQKKLEEIKGKSLAEGTYPDPDNPIVVSGKDFNVEIVVKDVVEKGLSTGLKKITTTVEWQKRNGTRANVTVEGLQSKALAPPDTDVPTAILLSISPSDIKVAEQSLIKVTILDQDNYPIAFEGQINLSMNPETLGDLNDEFLIFNGESYITTEFIANDSGEAGVVVINAVDDAGELIPDSDMITILGGEPVGIDLSADPNSIIINGDTSTLTVKITDEDGVLADYWTGIVELTLTSGNDTGDLGEPPVGDTITLSFEEENIKTTLFTSSAQEGEAIVTATDQAGILDSDSVTINVTSGPPYQIDISAEPKSIFIAGYEGGPTSSTITVTIKNETGIPVSGFIGTISLSILSGEESGSLLANSLPFNGESTLSTTFTSATIPGNVIIEARDTTSTEPLAPDTDSLTVATGPPQFIEIVAAPDIIVNDGVDSSTLTVILKDFHGNVSSFDEDKELTFSLNPDKGTVNNTPLTLPAGHSQISTTYICADESFEGNVDITVNCEGILEGSTTTVQVAQRAIRESENPNIRYGGRWIYDYWRRTWIWSEDREQIFFDIDVLGGTIDISQIDLAWKEGTSLGLQAITIRDISSNVKVQRSWYYSYPSIPIYPAFYEISSFQINQTLGVGTYTIQLDCRGEIENRTLIIQFHGTYSGKTNIYQLEFLSPDYIV